MKATLGDDIEIRPFNEEDRYEVATLIRSILTEFNLAYNQGGLTAELAKLTRRYTEDGAVFWVLLHDSKVAGIAGIRPHGELAAQIEHFSLNKKLRGRGIGTKMLEFVEEQAYKIGYRRLFVSCPRPMETGKKFLEKLDYRMVGNEQQEAVEDLFEKEL